MAARRGAKRFFGAGKKRAEKRGFCDRMAKNGGKSLSAKQNLAPRLAGLAVPVPGTR